MMRLSHLISAGVMLLALPTATLAQEDSEKTTPVDQAEKDEDKKGKDENNGKDNNQKGPLDGFGFGLSLALTFDLGSNDRIKGATLDPNGIVRVTDEENVTGRFLLETHRFFTPFTSQDIGIGPFVAVEAGSDPIIQGLGGGLMVGFKTSGDNDASNATSFNIGVGVIYDLNTQILGDDIVANEPLPDGETLIRFKETEQSGLMIISSFSFY